MSSTPGVLLLAAMLLVMLVRVFTPFGQRPTGETLVQFTLPFRQRLLYQRTNIYLVGVVMVLGGFGGWLSALMQTVVVLAAFMIISMPVRYTLTTDGIGLNTVVFRNWTEFTSLEQTPRFLRLHAKDGMRDFKILPPPAHRDTLIAAIEHAMSPDIRPATGKGGGKAKRQRSAVWAKTI